MNNASLFCAIRGPVMLITIGTLFALDHMGAASFGRTWPMLIIVFGVLKLLEKVSAPPAPPLSNYGGSNYDRGGPVQQ